MVSVGDLEEERGGADRPGNVSRGLRGAWARLDAEAAEKLREAGSSAPLGDRAPAARGSQQMSRPPAHQTMIQGPRLLDRERHEMPLSGRNKVLLR